MGCGSSSLKGDDVPDVNSQPVTGASQAGQPIKKVKTNFSDVDYDQGGGNRRMTEYAPHETPAPVREESFSAEQQTSNDVISPGQTDLNASNPMAKAYLHEGVGPTANAIDGEPDTKLKPYKTADGGDWDNDTSQQNPSSHQAQPYLNGDDPTSYHAKDDFASANDPANPLNQESQHNANHQVGANNMDTEDNHDNTRDSDNPAHDQHKKSWMGQKYSNFQTAKRGTGASDEDVLKYTGKDKQGLGEWAQGRGGVGGNQDGGRVGTDSGIAAGAAWN